MLLLVRPMVVVDIDEFPDIDVVAPGPAEPLEVLFDSPALASEKRPL